MKGQQFDLPLNLNNKKAKASMSRAQMKSMAYNDKQKVKKKLARKLQLSDSERIPDDLIREYQHRSHLDRLHTLLQSVSPRRLQNINHKKSVHRMPEMKRNSSNQSLRALEEGKFDRLKQLPYISQRQHVQWLTFSEQGRNQIDLANEIEKFFNYVTLSESEQKIRDGMVRDVQEAITSKWQAARVHQFGSHSVGLSIFLSDIDISVLGLGEDGKGVIEQHHTAENVNGHTGTSDSLPPDKAAVDGDWDAEEVDEDESDDGEDNEEIACAGSEISSDDNGIHGTVYSDEEMLQPNGVDDDEVGWFVDVKGNPDLLKADDNSPNDKAEYVDTNTPYKISSDLRNGGGRKRPLNSEDDHENYDEDEEESDSIDNNNYSDGEEMAAVEDSNDRTPASNVKIRSPHSSTSFKKPESSGKGVLLSEDLVVQYRDDSNICVVSSSALKRDKNSRDKHREVVFVDLVSDEDDAGKPSSYNVAEGKKVRNSVMDFSNVFDSDQLASLNSGRKPELKTAESMKRHKFQLTLLRDLLPHLKTMDWVRNIEFRGKAKVPIINFEHKNGLQCDMSIGISTQDTSAVVKRLRDVCGASFVPLAAFLKVLLYQQNLEKPFTGGLGSFKLYILLAYHLLYNQSMFSTAERRDYNPLGLQLLTFLRFYGSPRHLNQHAEIALPFLSEKVSFQQTFQVEKVQRLFEKCYVILHKICKERIQMNNGESSQASVVEAPERSYSALGCIIDSAQLSNERAAYLARSRRYPVLSDAEKDEVAAKILRALADKNPSGLHMHVDIEQVKILNPRMAARLRSYTQADHAFSGSAGSRQADRDANVDRASKRRKIDGSNSPTGNGNNSTIFDQGPLHVKAYPLLSQKNSEAARRRNDAAITRFICKGSVDGAILPPEVAEKIRESNLSEGLKQQILAPNFRPDSLTSLTNPRKTKKAEEAEKLAMMSVKLKEKLVQLKKQAETSDNANRIESEDRHVPTTGSLLGQSQSRAGKKDNLESSTDRDNAGNVFYDEQPLSHSTIAANPSISGKAVVEMGQSKSEKETERFEGDLKMNALSPAVFVPRPPPPPPPVSARKDKEKSACLALKQCTSKLMSVIDDLDYAIAIRMKSRATFS